MRILPYLLMLMCSAVCAQKKTFFLITDAERVGGVCRQAQTDPKDQEMRQLLTGEINAAVEGFLAGGADEVIGWDGHDGSQTLSTLTIHFKAKLLMGALPASMPYGAALLRSGLRGPAQPRGGTQLPGGPFPPPTGAVRESVHASTATTRPIARQVGGCCYVIDLHPIGCTVMRGTN
jgi:hypothetical protein